MSTPAPGPSASPVIYEERLWPAPWIWLVVAGAAGASVVTFAPINLTTGFIAATVVAVVLVTLLVLSTPRIVVTSSHLTVGRATLERQFLGEATAYMGEDATAQRGPQLNATAYLCIRGWISPVVRVAITDPADPTPYWMTSTRRPDQLVAALAS
ncbi:hypothetical protein IWX64_001655 [Arthrobacter sp. CAN_A212]|uniref:DUF3093 domain-containing protein n=1 Tax=Arthrobacter sp. CAN_A212 TaxID=2787719 RepID=UPI0018C9ED09